jgi:hypothetical protein
MSLIGRADANGAGSASSAADTKPDRTAPTRGKPRGPADDPNTTWSKAPKQVAEGPKITFSKLPKINFTKIDKILNDLPFAELRLAGANNDYRDAQIKNSPEKQEKKQKYEDVKKDYLNVQIQLGEAIDAETKRLSHPSSISLVRHGLSDSGDVRRLEDAILTHAKLSGQQGQVQDAVLENRRLRAPRELSDLSAKMRATSYVLKPNQIKEQENIIADARDSVIGRRGEENDLTPEEVTKKRFDRLSELLDTVTTRKDPVTGQDQKFDPHLYDLLISNIKAQMGPFNDADDKKFDGLVASYSDRLARRM